MSRDSGVSRRELVKTAGAIGAIGTAELAGCSGGGGGNSGSNDGGGEETTRRISADLSSNQLSDR